MSVPYARFEEAVVLLAWQIFTSLNRAGYIVMGMGKSRYESWLHKDGEGFNERYEVNARKKYDELQLGGGVDIGSVVRTPLEFPEGSSHVSCGLMGGVRLGKLSVALSGLAGVCDRLIASLLLARYSEILFLCQPKVLLWNDAEVAEVRVFCVATYEYLKLISLVSRVSGCQIETTLGGHKGLFVRMPDDPRPAPAFGFVFEEISEEVYRQRSHQ